MIKVSLLEIHRRKHRLTSPGSSFIHCHVGGNTDVGLYVHMSSILSLEYLDCSIFIILSPQYLDCSVSSILSPQYFDCSVSSIRSVQYLALPYPDCIVFSIRTDLN